MEFNKVKPIFSSDVYYDLFIGGYINPSLLLKNDDDIIKVENSIETIKSFLHELNEAEIIIEV